MPKLDRDIAAETTWTDFEHDVDIEPPVLDNPTVDDSEPPVLENEPSSMPVEETACPEPGFDCEGVQLSQELYSALSGFP
jgi:hypothetical protein